MSEARRRGTLDEFSLVCGLITLDNGDPFLLEPWQSRVIEDFLSGTPEVHLWVPEANGKTTMAAAVALFHLITTPNPRAVVAAASELQARTLYNQAVGMVMATPLLDERLMIREGSLEIRRADLAGGFGLKVIAADEKRTHGQINTLVVLDEMQAHPGLGLYRVLAGKLQKRGGQLLSITTAGEPDSEFETMRTEILRASPSITHGGPDERWTRAAGPQHVAWNFALRPDDDAQDMNLVKAANPLAAITPDTLRAKRDLPGYEEKHWRTYVCNLPTRDFVSRFLPEAEWAQAGDDDGIPEGEPVTLGIDWGWIDDATAIVPIWARDDDVLVLGPAVILEPPRNGTQLSPARVEDELVRIGERNPIIGVAHDSSTLGGGHLMGDWLDERLVDAQIAGVDPRDVVDATGHFLEQLRNGMLVHSRDATLTRHLLNAIRVPVGTSGDLFKLGRPKASRNATHQRSVREIDAAVAAVLAVWGAIGVPAAPYPFFEIV